MEAVYREILHTPTGNLLILAGLVFLAIAVGLKVTGKIEPDNPGRIASGLFGVALLVAGIVMHGVTPSDAPQGGGPIAAPSAGTTTPQPKTTKDPTNPPSPPSSSPGEPGPTPSAQGGVVDKDGKDPGTLTPEEAFRAGDRLVKSEPARAAEFLAQACVGDHGVACGELALMYDQGLGVSRDENRGARLHARAVALEERGCAAGASGDCWALGFNYYHGRAREVGRDVEKARHYLEIACKLQTEAACRMLKDLPKP